MTTKKKKVKNKTKQTSYWAGKIVEIGKKQEKETKQVLNRELNMGSI